MESSQVLVTESCVKGYSENFIHRGPIKQRAYTGIHYFYNWDHRKSGPNPEIHSQCKAYKMNFADKKRLSVIAIRGGRGPIKCRSARGDKIIAQFLKATYLRLDSYPQFFTVYQKYHFT